MDPVLGKFTSEDPAFDGVNWFAYCANNPINRIDITGNASQSALGSSITGLGFSLLAAYFLFYCGLSGRTIGLAAGAAAIAAYYYAEAMLPGGISLPGEYQHGLNQASLLSVIIPLIGSFLVGWEEASSLAYAFPFAKVALIPLFAYGIELIGVYASIGEDA